MKCNGLVKVLFYLSVVAFVVGVVGNLLQFASPGMKILWEPLVWWRGSMGVGLFAMILTLFQIRDALAAHKA